MWARRGKFRSRSKWVFELSAGRVVRVVRWLSCLVLMVPVGMAARQPMGSKRVLLLHQSAGPGPGASRGRFDVAFAEAIRSGGSVPIDLYEETIDTMRFPGPDQSLLVTDYLKSKYADRTIDVIVAQGMQPFNFARRNRALFGSPPIVAIVSPAGQIAVRNEDVTGLQGG